VVRYRTQNRDIIGSNTAYLDHSFLRKGNGITKTEMKNTMVCFVLTDVHNGDSYIY
jgi:hypothetical protein